MATRPCGMARQSANLRLRLANEMDDALGVGFEQLARFRQHDAAPIAVQQLDASSDSSSLIWRLRMGWATDRRMQPSRNFRIRRCRESSLSCLNSIARGFDRGLPTFRAASGGRLSITARSRNGASSGWTKGLATSPSVSIQTLFSCRYSRMAVSPLLAADARPLVAAER